MICLPPEAGPKSWAKYGRPVVPLKEALSGHPDSCTFWEEHYDKCLKRAGFHRLREIWLLRSFHPLKTFLASYVDLQARGSI